MLPTNLVGRFVVDHSKPREFPTGKAPSERATEEAAMNDAILQEIADFCRQTGLAESTFGRRAVNDGKLASRLRNGGCITTDTLDRIRAFMATHQGKPALARPFVIERSPGLRAPQRRRARSAGIRETDGQGWPKIAALRALTLKFRQA